MSLLLLIPAVLAILYATLAAIGLVRHARTSGARTGPAAGRAASPITILKPLAGADDDLEACLESFFVQDHPRYELLLGAERADDPALEVARRVMGRHPDVAATVVVHGRAFCTNPKVSNLLGLLPHARHELLLISDSNVRAPRGTLTALAEAMADDVGLVSNLFAGTGERTVGAALECATLSGFVAAGVVVPALSRDPVVVGKSMMVRRSALERLGGLASVGEVLAEDYLIGKMLQHGGWKVALAPTVVENVCRRTTLRAFVARQLRWSMIRMRLHPLAFLLEPLSGPLAVVPLAWAMGGPWAALLAYAALVIARDGVGWVALRGPGRWWIPLATSPARELIMLGVWAVTPLVKHVSWRGHAVRLGTGTRVFVGDPARTGEGGRAPARVG